MQLSDFDFELPEALIAQFPPATRGDSRLLHVDGLCCTDDHFSQLSAYLRAGDVLVFNDTRVLKGPPVWSEGQRRTGGNFGRARARRPSGAGACAPSKSPKPGSRLLLEGRWQAEMVERQEALFLLRFLDEANVLDILEQSGKLPLPPYITRDADSPDDERYQTVYARHRGAVARPPPACTFTDTQLDALRAQGVKLAFVTPACGRRHVSAGAGGQYRRAPHAQRAVRHPARHRRGNCPGARQRRPGGSGGHHQPARAGIRRAAASWPPARARPIFSSPRAIAFAWWTGC